MQLNQDYNTNTYSIRAYADDHVLVACPVRPNVIDTSHERPQPLQEVKRLEQSFVIGLERLDVTWPLKQIEDLDEKHLQELVNWHPEIVILGTGTKIRFPAQKHIAYFWQKGIGFEVMDSQSACRTYNFLQADQRKVVAAIML
ncbi:MAG: MTH938/NDUFAF3 family protein [Gammaproteobacteria bacterium]|nr:MTH938/NDUFAF3 family protein [Gammaproteobacteria bacterium]MDH5729249.1 MTH938/NDUFAF3 family protein [Gammaproteobacteria bacterium]